MAESSPQAMDVAAFALPATAGHVVRFEEPRDVARVAVGFRGRAPAKAGLSYLQRVWPTTRVEAVSDTDNPCGFGWIRSDDWFNGQWRPAAVQVQRRGASTLVFTFRGLTAEFPEVKDYDVMFRRTLGLRVDVADAACVRRVEVFTTSAPVRTALRVELDAGKRTPGRQIHCTGYNAVVEKLSAVAGVRVAGASGPWVLEIATAGTPTYVGVRGMGKMPMPRSAAGAKGRGPRAFRVELRHMSPAHRYAHDDGQLTFDTGDDAFTISLESLARQGPIWFAEKGVFITRADDAATFAEYRRRNQGAKTIREMVLERPEQSFAGAYHGQPHPHAVAFSFGCMHARQRFWLEPNGDLVLTRWNVLCGNPPPKDLAGRDTGKFANDGNGRFFFGLENWYATARVADPAPVPAYTLGARQAAVQVEQRCFAVPLMRSILDGELPGDETIVAFVRFRFTNTGEKGAEARLRLGYSQNSDRSFNALSHGIERDDHLIPRSRRDPIVLTGNRLSTRGPQTRAIAFGGPLRQERPVLRCAFETTMSASARGTEATFSRALAPGESCELLLKVPFVAAEGADELAALERLDFDKAQGEMVRFWRRAGGQGCQLQTPEPHLNDLYLGHLTHVRFSDFAMPDGSGLINTSVGSSTYGNFSNESCMIVQELDQRGLHQEARRRLELWVRYQGTAKQPGNFTDYDGMFFGAGGFECGAYNQHHGWVLWRLCEHYFLTRDRAWMEKVAPAVLAGADWVFRQRRNTTQPLPHSRGWERGFLPAGSLEDVTDFWYWLSTNCLTWRGAEWAARALAAVGHAEAARIRGEADCYRADLVNGFETARKYCPLVRLRDGRWVPHYPSRLYLRGRDTGWIREVLEGAVYLLISGLYEPGSQAAGWILDDYQDNLYIRPPYGYYIQDEPINWFDRSGLSMQPNLLAGLLPHLDRDEPEMFIWMFFNAWCACYRDQIGAMVEHPYPVLGYSNSAHPKTSDEANAVMWLRYMFVYERGGLLHLGRALPRAWFRHETLAAGPVATSFGNVSVRYAGDRQGRKLSAEVALKLEHRPDKLLVRFRHPDKAPIRSVTVNARAHRAFDATQGDVDLTGLDGRISVEATYYTDPS